ncbi:MAG: T9SS type A sorting domain-containing protein [Bacteroidota bacterium]|nr:T9SS type A sorting domain-containing protein [Bacteroidota bacterium]
MKHALFIVALLLALPLSETRAQAVPDTCAYLIDRAHFILLNPTSQDSKTYAYDTTRLYLEHCYDTLGSEAAFNDLIGENQERRTDPNNFVEFRAWLKSVLYLRLDSAWYCADVWDILTSMDYYPGKGLYMNGVVAIARYVVEHGHCDSVVTANFHYKDTNGIRYIYTHWRDTVKDSLHEPGPDTTIPSIDSLGLSILRGPEFSEVTTRAKGTDLRVTSIRATENPFTKATEIVAQLADYGLVKFELFDALGNLVAGNGGLGQVLEPGQHTFEIDGAKLPAGAYFARVAFHNGDVKSVMLVKE